MKFILQPWQLFLLILASWINRQQQAVIEYLHTENAVLKEKLGKKRILLSDDQRRRLAVKGKILGRKKLSQVGTLFTPDTILRWHRQLVAQKWDYSDRKEKKPGRPRVRQVIVELALQFAKQNPTRGLRPYQWCIVECRLHHQRHNHRQHPQSTRHRTSANSQANNKLGNVSQIVFRCFPRIRPRSDHALVQRTHQVRLRARR